MPLRQISSREFENYNIDRQPSLMLAEEVYWVADDEANLLGTVLIDKIDKDWSYVALALESDGYYRLAAIEVSIEDEHECRQKLAESIKSISVTGNYSEPLYQNNNSEILSPDSGFLIKDIDEEVKRYLKKNPDKLYELNPRKFEELVASIFEDFGFTVELTKATRDGGRDIIARIRNAVMNIVTYVECKRHSPDNKVNVGIVREVIGVHYIRNPSKSIIVTTSFFTKDAIAEANRLENQLELKDFNHIKKWLGSY